MQPWGISGPLFLLYYTVAVVAGFAVAWYARGWAGRPSPADPPSTVDFAEAAFVAGGTGRVIDTAVARLVAGARFRVNRKGVLSAPGDPVSDHPVDRDVHQALGHRSMKAYQLRKRVKAMPEVQALAARVTAARGHRSATARALAKYGSMALLLLVVAAGVVRAVEGIAADRPVGYLVVLLVVSVSLIAAFYLAFWSMPVRTPNNDPVLVLARRRLAGVDLVAVSGLSAYPDEELRATLVASATPPKPKGRKPEAQYHYGPQTSSSDGGGGGCGGGNP